MITRLFGNPMLLTQTTGNESAVPEPAIGISLDASGLIVLVQEGREIIVNRETVPDLIKALKQQAAKSKECNT